MSNTSSTTEQKSDFHLEKWFLDVVTEEGEAMIFYAAQLEWKGWKVPYTSWLHYNPAKESEVEVKTRFRKVNIPVREERLIRWEDHKFGVEGQWEAKTDPIKARLFDSEEGYLDWYCFQPASKVTLKIGDRLVEGRGYAEKLIMTVPAWKIPMDELRWGRYGGGEDYLVWVELRTQEKKQWL